MNKIKRADDFRPLEFDEKGELKVPKDEIEQRVLLNSLTLQQAALWMLKRGEYRHEKDLIGIKRDIAILENQGVTLPPELRFDLWFEIPIKDERTGNGVK